VVVGALSNTRQVVEVGRRRVDHRGRWLHRTQHCGADDGAQQRTEDEVAVAAATPLIVVLRLALVAVVRMLRPTLTMPVGAPAALVMRAVLRIGAGGGQQGCEGDDRGGDPVVGKPL
jgi:hypothetical protein